MKPLLFLLLVGMCPPKGVNVPQPAPASADKPASQMTVVGTLTTEGVECQAMREDGTRKLFTLAGKLAGFKAGDRVKVVGKIAETSFCMQGTTIDVASIAHLESPPPSNR